MPCCPENFGMEFVTLSTQISTHALCPYLRMPAIENSLNAQLPQYGEEGQTGDESGEFIFIRKQGR